MHDPLAVIDRLDRAIIELHEATRAAVMLARTQTKQLAAQSADDDEWLRMPGKKAKCPILGCSHMTIRRHIAAGAIRQKHAIGTVFYSGADARQLISEAP